MHMTVADLLETAFSVQSAMAAGARKGVFCVVLPKAISRGPMAQVNLS
jgi:hypothetical protein